MTKQVVLRAMILMSVLLVLNGCKSDTASDAKRGDPVLVIDQGQEPREQLRYNIAPGTTTTSTMEYALASLATTTDAASLTVTPGVRLHIISGPTMEGKRGSTRFDVRIVKAEAIVPEGADPQVKLDLNKSVSVLNNVGGWVEVDECRKAVEAWVKSGDTVACFLEDECDRETNSWTTTKDLYARYGRWCELHGMTKVGGKQFTTQLQTEGFTSHRTAEARGWKGISLKPMKPGAVLRDVG